MAPVFQQFNRIALFGSVKTRPTAVGIELGFTLEQLCSAASAAKSA
jgi:hypothetical protein